AHPPHNSLDPDIDRTLRRHMGSDNARAALARSADTGLQGQLLPFAQRDQIRGKSLERTEVSGGLGKLLQASLKHFPCCGVRQRGLPIWREHIVAELITDRLQAGD